jgi:hypothetical protein
VSRPAEVRVDSPEYDQEVIFTASLRFDVDDVPEWEPQIRSQHFPPAEVRGAAGRMGA